jgi:hypothetical protein
MAFEPVSKLELWYWGCKNLHKAHELQTQPFFFTPVQALRSTVRVQKD